MPDHDSLMQNVWMLGSISLGGGVFASQVAGFVGELGFGLKVMVSLSIAAIIFGTIWFFAPAHV